MSSAKQGIPNEDELKLLPRGFKRVGHIAIVSMPPELADKAEHLAQKILSRGNVRTVAIRDGTISGRYRVPRLRVVAGDPTTETIHFENGCRFKLDVAKVMFSSGNVYERKRIAELVSPNEVVVDLFAGIGQFSIPIAVHAKPSKVYSIEMNQVAHGYLSENIRINKVGHIVRPMLGDCSEVAPRGVADRVIMGLLHITHRYLPLAIEVLKPEGGIVHYHESVPTRLRFERPINRILQSAVGRRVEIMGKRVVKRYAPGVDHVVIDARISPGGG